VVLCLKVSQSKKIEKIDKIELDSTQARGLVKYIPLRASLYKGSGPSKVSFGRKEAKYTVVDISPRP